MMSLQRNRLPRRRRLWPSTWLATSSGRFRALRPESAGWSLQCGQPVDTCNILLPAILLQSLTPFVLAPTKQRFAIGAEFIQRTRVSAGVADPGHVDVNDGAGAEIVGESCIQTIPLCACLGHHRSHPVKPNDL